jgi:Na+/melibiose symporter-like transporter
MKTRTYDPDKFRRTGSAWAVLFKGAGLLILFFLFPLIALKNSDAIDSWGSSADGQLVIFWVIVSVVGSYGVMWFVKKVKSAW